MFFEGFWQTYGGRLEFSYYQKQLTVIYLVAKAVPLDYFMGHAFLIFVMCLMFILFWCSFGFSVLFVI